VKLCPEVEEAVKLIDTRKFEAVFIDFMFGLRAVSVLQSVHESPSNRTAVTFAIVSNREEASLALQRRAHFLLERPLNTEALTNTVRAAYGSILRERRRYFRYAVSIPVLLRSGNQQMPGEMLNISERGMALKVPVRVAAGSDVTLQFFLPDIGVPMATEAKVCWSHPQGDMGVQFSPLPAESSDKLSSWLAQKLEEQLPKNVTEKFGSPTNL
jgi:hypothetical protein